MSFPLYPEYQDSGVEWLWQSQQPHRGKTLVDLPPGTLYSLPMNAEFAPLFKLGLYERLQLVEDLWDSIVEEGAPLSVSEETRTELRARKERFQANPGSGLTWEQVKQQARSAHD